MALKKEDLQEWQRLKAEAAALTTQQRTISERVKQLEESFTAELEKTGKQSIVRHGFTLCWLAGSATVAWAKEFLALAGAEKVQELKDQATAQAKPKLAIAAPKE
jgi:hypothetical protein